jgi:hypothetical protein
VLHGVPLADAFGTHSEAVAIALFPAARSQLLRAFSAAVFHAASSSTFLNI